MAQRGALQTMFALVSKLAKREDKDKEAERKSNNNIYVSPPQDFKVIFHMSPLDAQRIMGHKIITETEEPATDNTSENENTAQPDAYLRPDRPLVLRPPSIALPQPPNTYCGSEVSTRTNIEMIALSRGWISMDELTFDNSVDGSLNSTYDDNDDVYTYIDEDDEELAAIGRRRSASRASLPASVIPNPHGHARRHDNGSNGSEPWCPEQLPMDAPGIPRLPQHQHQHQQRLFVKKADRKCESVVAAKINARFRQQADGRAMSQNNMTRSVDNLNVSLPTTPRPQLSPKPARIVQHLPSQILRPTILIPMSEVSEDRDTFPSVKVDVEHQIRHQSLCSAGNELLLPPEQPPPPPRSVSRMSSSSSSPSPSSPPKAAQPVNEPRARLSVSPASMGQMQHQTPSRNDQRSPSRTTSPRPPSRGELRPPSRQPSPPPPSRSGGQRSPSRQLSPRPPSVNDPRSPSREPSPRPPSRNEIRAQTSLPSPSRRDKPSRKPSPLPPSRSEMLPPPLPLSSPPGSGSLVRELTNRISTSPGFRTGDDMTWKNQSTSKDNVDQRSQFTFNRAYVGEEKNKKLHVAAQATNNAYALSRDGKASVTVPQRSPDRPPVSPKTSRLLSPTPTSDSASEEERTVARRSNKQSTGRRSQDNEQAHKAPPKHQANSQSRHSPPDCSRLLGPSHSTASQPGSQSGRTRPIEADKAVSTPGPMRTEPIRLPGAPTLTTSVQRNPSRFEMESTISKASKLFGVRLNHVDKGSTESSSSNEGSCSLNHRMLTRSQATPLTERPPAWSIWQRSNSPVSPSPTSAAQKPRTPPKPM